MEIVPEIENRTLVPMGCLCKRICLLKVGQLHILSSTLKAF